MSRLQSMRSTSTFRLHHVSALVLAMLAVCAITPARAAKVYRCGNVFQDQPCPEVKIAAAAPIERTQVAREAPCAAPAGRDPGARNERGPCLGKTSRDGLHQVTGDIKH